MDLFSTSEVLLLLKNESLFPSLHRRMWAGRGQLWTRFVSVSLPER